MTRDAVILAAGLGTRLRPITNDMPKCLVKINNTTILDRIIHQIEPFVEQINIVIGEEGRCWNRDSIQKVKDRDHKTIINPKNKSEENSYSLQLGLEDCEADETLIIDGDLVIETRLVNNLIRLGANRMLSREAKYKNERGGRIRTEDCQIVDIEADNQDLPFVYSGASMFKATMRNHLQLELDNNKKVIQAISQLLENFEVKNYDTTDVPDGWININNKSRLELAKEKFGESAL